jgi:hypothetical protein
VTFGVVVRAPVPNGRMSDPFPADHGLTTRSPMASGGFRIAAHVRLRCAFPLDTGHVLAVGSMVPKVTSVRQFRLNSSLYVSGPTGRAGAPRSFFLCGTMPGREGNASRRRTTTTQLHYFGFSLHEMSPVHWTDG